MAGAKLEAGAVHRVRSEVNSLWRKAVAGVDGGGARVGGYPITFTIWNAESVRKNQTNSEDLVKPQSLVMKSKILDFMDEIDDLKRTVDELSEVVQEAGDTRTLMSMSDRHHGDSLATQVAMIKKQFHSIHEEGKEAYCDLEREEIELEKDIKTLRVVVSEEFCSHTEKSSGEIKSVKKISENKMCNKSSVNRTERKVSDLKGGENGDGARAARDVTSQGVKLNGMSCFRHSWDEKDHIQFVKVYQQQKLKHKQLQEWQRMFPYKTENDILDHATAYEAFIKEREKVRSQIIQWKSKREQVKRELHERLIQEKLENENKVKLVNKAKEERLKEEREERFKKLDEWKRRRKNVGSVDRKVAGVCTEMAERKKSVNSLQHKIHCLKFTDEERANMATHLHLYRQQKEKQKQEEIQKKQEELQFKKLCSVSNRKEFRKRDEQHINRKKEQKELQVRLKEEETKRLERIKSGIQIKAESSKDRLFKPTLNHEAYKLSSQIKEKYSASVDQIPRLATPAWRQET